MFVWGLAITAGVSRWLDAKVHSLQRGKRRSPSVNAPLLHAGHRLIPFWVVICSPPLASPSRSRTALSPEHARLLCDDTRVFLGKEKLALWNASNARDPREKLRKVVRVVLREDRVGHAPDYARRHLRSAEHTLQALEGIRLESDEVAVDECLAVGGRNERTQVLLDRRVGGMRAIGVAHSAETRRRPRTCH